MGAVDCRVGASCCPSGRTCAACGSWTAAPAACCGAAYEPRCHALAAAAGRAAAGKGAARPEGAWSASVRATNDGRKRRLTPHTAAPRRRRCGRTAQSSCCTSRWPPGAGLQRGGWVQRAEPHEQTPTLASHPTWRQAVASLGDLRGLQLCMQPCVVSNQKCHGARTLGQHQVDQLAAVRRDQACALRGGSGAAAGERDGCGRVLAPTHPSWI